MSLFDASIEKNLKIQTDLLRQLLAEIQALRADLNARMAPVLPGSPLGG